MMMPPWHVPDLLLPYGICRILFDFFRSPKDEVFLITMDRLKAIGWAVILISIEPAHNNIKANFLDISNVGWEINQPPAFIWKYFLLTLMC